MLRSRRKPSRLDFMIELVDFRSRTDAVLEARPVGDILRRYVNGPYQRFLPDYHKKLYWRFGIFGTDQGMRLNFFRRLLPTGVIWGIDEGTPNETHLGIAGTFWIARRDHLHAAVAMEFDPGYFDLMIIGAGEALNSTQRIEFLQTWAAKLNHRGRIVFESTKSDEASWELASWAPEGWMAEVENLGEGEWMTSFQKF